MKQTNKLSLNKTSILKYLSTLALVFLSMLVIQNTEAQENDNTQDVLLTGTVLDHENLPLPGLSIVLKGTKIGTATDFDGKYTFPEKLNEGDVLVFSFLGYSPKKVTIAKDQKILNVVMEAELVELMGAIDTNRSYKSRKSLWQKIKGVF